MAVRNCAEIGENLIKIVKRLQANQSLLKLIYYTDKDPLSHDDLTEAQIQNEVFNQLIKIIPIAREREDTKSMIIIKVTNGSTLSANDEFKIVNISIEVLTPPDNWIIKGTNLRPFAILGEIQKTLSGKTVNGLGKMEGGDFQLEFLTEEMTGYSQNYTITSYD